MSQSNTPVPLCQTLQWVFRKPRCLGQVLFLLYINDMHGSSNKMGFIRFADDTTVYASDTDINNVHASVNRELVGVYEFILHFFCKQTLLSSKFIQMFHKCNSKLFL